MTLDHGVLTMESRSEDAVLTLRYPRDVGGSGFQESFAAVSRELEAHDRRFALVHDMRMISWTSVGVVDAIALEALAWSSASAIAKRGFLRKVAFCLDVNPILRTTLSWSLYLSPVQPARIFDNYAEADAWAAAS